MFVKWSTSVTGNICLSHNCGHQVVVGILVNCTGPSYCPSTYWLHGSASIVKLVSSLWLTEYLRVSYLAFTIFPLEPLNRWSSEKEKDLHWITGIRKVYQLFLCEWAYHNNHHLFARESMGWQLRLQFLSKLVSAPHDVSWAHSHLQLHLTEMAASHDSWDHSPHACASSLPGFQTEAFYDLFLELLQY